MGLFRSRRDRRRDVAKANLSRRLLARFEGVDSGVERLEDRCLLTYTSTLTGSTASMVGTGVGDTLTFQRAFVPIPAPFPLNDPPAAGNYLFHNRFTAGDAGFASDFDFDTTLPGTQYLAAALASTVDISAVGPGSDVLNLGTLAVPADQLLATFDFSNNGTGNDSVNINLTNSAAAATFAYATTGLTGGGVNFVNGTISDGGVTLFTSGVAGNIVNVLSSFTNEPFNVVLNATGTVNVGNAGSTQGINAQIDVQQAANGSPYTLNIDDSADAVGRTVGINNGSVTGIAPASITFDVFDLSALNVSGGSGGNTFNVNFTPNNNVFAVLTTLNTGTGSDTINVFGVSGFGGASLVVNGQSGNDVFAITATGVGGAATFNGGDGNDDFNVNFSGGGNIFAPSFLINGDAALLGGRDRVNLNANILGDGARNITVAYQAAAGAANVSGLGTTIGLGTVEQINYAGDAFSDDVVNVVGIAASDDVVSVTPLSFNAANVFLNGSPTITIPPGAPGTNNPGIAGGGTSPDVNLQGLATFGGLNVSGGGALPGGGDQLVVNGCTENLNGVANASAWAGNAFGSGSAIRPAGQAFDTINVTETVVSVSNNVLGQLVRVNFLAGAFDRLNSAEPDVIVNSGEEDAANLPLSGIADDFFITPSAITRFQLNGGDPIPATAPRGDRLTIFASVVGVWSDKATPPNVTLSIGNLLPIGTNSIERTDINATTVNFIGDNNNPAVDQNDNYVIRGTGPNAFTATINGSGPLFFSGVSFLNAFGDDQNPPPGTPSAGPNDIDTLDIQAYADNTPQGWGVAVSFDEGNPPDADGNQADLIIYNGINGVSEDIVVRPSSLQNGQLVVTQGLTGVPIVIINFLANTDILFVNANNAGQPDTDALTLSGSLAQQPGTAIDQTFIVDLSAAGNAAAPKITVNNNVPLPFYRVQNFTNFTSLTIDAGAGVDVINLVGTANADTYTINQLGLFDSDLTVALNGFAPLAIRAIGTESILAGSGGGADTAIINALSGVSNSFLVSDFGGTTIVRPNDGPGVNVTGMTTVRLGGFTGADTLNFESYQAAYTLNAGAAPTLVSGTITFDLATVEYVNMFGRGAADALTVVGTAGDDLYTVTSTSAGEASLSATFAQPALLGLSVQFFSGYVLNGGTGGFDQVKLLGTNGNDTVTSNLVAVTINGAAVNVATGIDRLEIGTFAGIDNITLSLAVAGLAKYIDAGDDNDTVDLSGVTADATILGGNGDDNIIGSPTADWIDGGAGNDTINGGAGNDTIYGGDGNDSVTGGTGSDQFFGGDGSDTFIWNPGDGSDLIEGQGGQNILIFNGSDAANDIIALTAVGTRLRLDRQPGNVVIDAAGFQQVNINAGGGQDSVTINNLEDTEVAVINVTLGLLATPYTPDNVRDTVVINGRQVANEISLTVQQVFGQPAGTTQVDVEGLKQHIFLGGTVANWPVLATDDVLTINTGSGNDHIVADQGVELKIATTINAGNGDDYVQANATIFGGNGNDTLLGAGGNCSLLIDGGAGNDLICGNEGGNDTLLGGAGRDRIYGLGGNDSIDGGAGDDLLAGNAGNDTLLGGDGNDTAVGGAGNDAIDGGNGNDLLMGDADVDCGETDIHAIDSGHGNDLILGRDGNDTINGDLGNDTLFGENGNDLIGPVQLYGTVLLPVAGAPGDPNFPGNALVLQFGDAGNDFMFGGNGNDTINGDTGDDSMTGGDGNDSLYGGDGNDTVRGNAGNDVVAGDAGDDQLHGGDGEDLISGGTGNDQIYGGAGNDTIEGGTGNDTIEGGTGDDVISGNEGADSILGGDGNDQIYGNADDDTIDGGNGNDLILGGDGNDSILGGDGNDTIYGEAGDDYVEGNAGHDLILGGDGNDVLLGNAGNDTLCAGNGDDMLDGGDGDDVGLGEAGNDTLYGGDGNDQLWGGDGDDLVDAGAGNDSVVGGDGHDALLGGDGDDLIFGLAGNDIIWGGFGNDALYGGDGDDYILGGDPDTANILHGPRPPAWPSDGDDLISGGYGFDMVDGGNGNNWMDAGDDGIRETLLGGQGNDVAYLHWHQDVPALDGGHNVTDQVTYIVDPAVPLEQCGVVIFPTPIYPGLVHPQPSNPTPDYGKNVPSGPSKKIVKSWARR